MIRALTVALTLALVLHGVSTLAASRHAVSPRADGRRAAVCRVAVAEAGGQAFGSGTLIDAREDYGLVVTNWHVVRDATGPITVIFPDGFTSEARTVKLDETWDLAALVIWRPPVEPIGLAASPPRPGEALTICGWGQGDYREALGRCTDYYAPEPGKPMELVELGVQARQGDSGGPILNARGELAGVLFGAGQGVTLGSYGGRVRGFLATLAPDIGLPRPNTPGVPAFVAAVGSTVGSAVRPSQPPTRRDKAKAVDPFVVASRQAEPRPRAQHGQPAYAGAAPTPSDDVQLPSNAAHDWRSVPYAAWQVAAKRPGVVSPPPSASASASAMTIGSTATTQLTPPLTPPRAPLASNAGSATSVAGQALDLDSEQSTLIAVIGVSAVAVLLGRAFG